MNYPARTILILLGLLAAAAVPLFAQTEEATAPPTIEEQIDQIFFEWDRLDRPGGSAVVVRAGEVIFQRSYGLASMEHRTANTDRTLYDVAALAEPMTATAIAHLVAEGRLSLDDDIHDHFPELPAYDPPVRVRHLLDHTSGLWEWTRAMQLAGGYLEDVIALPQILDILGKQPAPVFTPGSQSEHSVSNYTLLAEIVTRVTGESYRDWLWAEILRPSGMIHCVVRDASGESVEGSAESYIYNPRRGYKRGSLNLAAPGAHSLYASIRNMATWLQSLTRENDPVELLAEGVLDDGTPTGCVHGMFRDTMQGLTRYQVAGDWQGWNTACHYFPEQRLGVIVLSNWVSGWVRPNGTAGQVAAVYLAEEIAAAAASADDEETPAVEATDFVPDPSRYEQLTGDYRWEPGNIFEIVVQGEKLAYKQGHTVLAMSELESDHFLLDDYPYYFTFSRDREERATTVLVQHAGDPDVTAPRIDMVQPSPEELAILAGQYHLTELDVSYSVHVEGETLMLTHRRRGDTRLMPEAADHFMAAGAPFTMLEFERDDDGAVVGFRLNTMDLLFRRMD